MCTLASEIKHNNKKINKTNLTGFCEIFFIASGETLLASTGRAWSLWVSDGCCGQSYSYSPFQPLLQGFGQRSCPSVMSSSRSTLVKSANGRKRCLHLGKSIVNARSCGSSGLSLSVRRGGFVSAQGEIFTLSSAKRPLRASPAYPGDL